MKNENNFGIINKPIAFIGLILMAFFFYLRFKDIYPIIQIFIYAIFLITGIYTLINSYRQDKKNNTSNFREKIIVIIFIITLFIISYLVLPLIFQ